MAMIDKPEGDAAAPNAKSGWPPGPLSTRSPAVSALAEPSAAIDNAELMPTKRSIRPRAAAPWEYHEGTV